MVHQDQGNYEEAVKKYNQALKIEEEMGDKRGIAQTLGQLGIIYIENLEYSSALQAVFTAFSIFKSLNSPYAQLAEKYLASLRDKMGEGEFNAQLERLVNE
jgi:tetratricopeptide (TPR) repeat protein